MSGAGWSSLAARRAHNPKVAGSNPAPATNHRGRHSRAGDVGHFFSVRDSRPSFPGAARNAMSVGMRCLPRTRKSEGVHPRAPMCWITLGLARGNAERAGAGRGRPRNSSDERPHDMPGGMLAGRGSCRCPPIGVSSVRNANDQHDEFIVAGLRTPRDSRRRTAGAALSGRPSGPSRDRGPPPAGLWPRRCASGSVWRHASVPWWRSR